MEVLHHDCISMIVSRFTIVTEDLVICCDQITKIFCTRYGSASASSAQGSCNFGPLTHLASVSREVIVNTVFTQIHTVRRRRNSVIHKIFFEFLQPFRHVGI